MFYAYGKSTTAHEYISVNNLVNRTYRCLSPMSNGRYICMNITLIWLNHVSQLSLTFNKLSLTLEWFFFCSLVLVPNRTKFCKRLLLSTLFLDDATWDFFLFIVRQVDKSKFPKNFFVCYILIKSSIWTYKICIRYLFTNQVWHCPS